MSENSQGEKTSFVLDGKTKNRLFADKFFQVLLFVLASLCAVPLIFIFVFITIKGVGAINIDFLTQTFQTPSEGGGGIIHGFIGSLFMVGLASIMAIPVGVGAGIYLAENPHKKLSFYIRSSSELLMGIPSIVVGIIAFGLVVIPLRGQRIGGIRVSYSALAGGVALGIMMLPMIVKSTEETLKLIPNTLKEASVALGVPYYKTMLSVVLPTGLSGIITGVLISLSRVLGETAPLIFTAGNNKAMNFNLFNQTQSLPGLIYEYAGDPTVVDGVAIYQEIAWGASFVLLVFVLFINILSRVVVSKWKIQF